MQRCPYITRASESYCITFDRAMLFRDHGLDGGNRRRHGDGEILPPLERKRVQRAVHAANDHAVGQRDQGNRARLELQLAAQHFAVLDLVDISVTAAHGHAVRHVLLADDGQQLGHAG